MGGSDSERHRARVVIWLVGCLGLKTAEAACHGGRGSPGAPGGMDEAPESCLRPPSHARRSQPLEAAEEALRASVTDQGMSQARACHMHRPRGQVLAWQTRSHRPLSFPQPRLGALGGTPEFGSPLQTQRSLRWDRRSLPLGAPPAEN